MKHFHFEKIIRANEIKQQKMQNHLINNYVIGNKKALFKTMLSFYKGEVFKFLPLTFHIQ
jgi:predicted nucleotide-binding protein (sugar kinase/HSP70/actin superfamily)